MSYIAGLVELLAKIVTGNKCKWGWILNIISGSLWAYVALTAEVYGLLLVAIPAIFINVHNFLKWHRGK